MEYNLVRQKNIKVNLEEANSDDLLKVLVGMKTYDKLKKYREFNFDDLKYIYEDEVKYLTIKEKNRVLALKEILKRGISIPEKTQIKTPKDCFEYLKDMRYLEQENLVVITLNANYNIISKKSVSIGDLNRTVFHPREIFKEAIKKSAHYIFLVHNHPSGDPTPSREDINMTLRVKEAGNILAIPLIDHMIIGENKYISLKEKGLI